MLDTIDINNPDMIYAALKFIQALYNHGHINQFVYQNILNDYAKTIDIAEFQCYNIYDAFPEQEVADVSEQ